MPKLTLQASGLKTAKAPGFNGAPEKRGQVLSWSRGSARRNEDFLRSIDPTELSGACISFTLTVRDLPATSEHWTATRNNFFRRLRHHGLVRLHWLTEFQTRGAPHLHGICYFDSPLTAEWLVWQWIEQTGCYRAAARGQHARQVDALVGWLQYLGKHGARSVGHYQRSVITPGWKKTGRLWGKLGEWPLDVEELFIPNKLFFKVRRFVRNRLVAECRADLLRFRKARNVHDVRRFHVARRRLVYLRRRLKCNDRCKSELRGSSDWIDPDLIRTFILHQRYSDAATGLSPWADRPGVSPLKKVEHSENEN